MNDKVLYIFYVACSFKIFCTTDKMITSPDVFWGLCLATFIKYGEICQVEYRREGLNVTGVKITAPYLRNG